MIFIKTNINKKEMSNNELKYKFCSKKERIAITCGVAAENHKGMEMLGDVGEKGSGFTISDLKQIKKRLEKNGIQCDYIDLTNDEAVEMQKKGYKSIKTNKKKEAGVLILRNYISENKIEKIYNELSNLEWDKKYYDTRRKTVLNKHARENLIFLKGRNQEPDYENKKGRIVDLNNLENLNSMMDKLFNTINKETGGKAKNLIGEGNRYYTIKDGKKVKNGIGWHGDAERRKVICFCIGGIDYCMKWQWFYKNRPVKTPPYKVLLNSGDVYIMSENAVGYNWKSSSIYSLRHCAGYDEFSPYVKYKKNWL